MDVDRPWIDVPVDAPDPIEELPARVRPTRMGGQQREEAVLLRAQVDREAIASELVGDEVEFQVVADVDRVSGLRMRPLLEQGQPAEQLGRRRSVGRGPRRTRCGAPAAERRRRSRPRRWTIRSRGRRRRSRTSWSSTVDDAGGSATTAMRGRPSASSARNARGSATA